MLRITGRDRSGWFCVGAVLLCGTVVRAAPKISYMIGWRRERVLRYANYRGWSVDELA